MEEIDISKDIFYAKDWTINALTHVYAKLRGFEDKAGEQDFVNEHMSLCKKLEEVYKMAEKTIKTFTLLKMSLILVEITGEALEKIKQDPTQIVQTLSDDKVKLSCVTVPKLIGDLNYNHKGKYTGIPGAQKISLLGSGIYAPVSHLESVIKNKAAESELGLDGKTAEQIAKPIIKFMANKRDIQLLVKDRKQRNIRAIKYSAFMNYKCEQHLAENVCRLENAVLADNYGQATDIAKNSKDCMQIKQRCNDIYQNRTFGLNVIKDYEYTPMPATLDKFLLTRS